MKQITIGKKTYVSNAEVIEQQLKELIDLSVSRFKEEYCHRCAKHINNCRPLFDSEGNCWGYEPSKEKYKEN